MQELVSIINQLEEVFEASDCKGLDLPQVVVIGTQSSGKSSVLEHLVGRSFLPRGSGVVTRCPLVLQLVPAAEEYVIFQHDKTKVFTDFRLITKEIEARTALLAGDNKGICRTPITLRVFSTCVPSLTLVDLPGLTKVPVGDQPRDVEQHTRKLSLEYINNPNSIILAVTPANVDMATSESLQLAREVDPAGERTLAVVTKLDLMDEGTDARDVLSGKVVPVRLGIIGVVNRSQKDITDGKSVKHSLQDEAAFLYTNYRSIAAVHGSPYLSKTVQRILMSHIKTCLPKLRDRIQEQLACRQTELLSLGGGGKLDKATHLLHLMIRFTNTYCATIRGNLARVKTKELDGGARIQYVFQDSLSAALRSIDPLAGLSRSAVLTAMQNASGATPALFVPEVAFELLLKMQIKRLRSPCLQCVDLIHEELDRIVQSCLVDPEVGIGRFPKLQHEISQVVTDLVNGRIPITKRMVDDIIDVQYGYINTAHPDFLPNLPQGTSGPSDCGEPGHTYPRPWSTIYSEHGQNQDKRIRDCLLIQELIQSYFSIVRKSVHDLVPKVIMHFLVNHVMDHLQSELVARLYQTDSPGPDLLEESAEVTGQRARASAALAALQKALQVLDSL